MSLRRRLWPAAAAGYDCIDGLCISAPPPATNTTYSDSDSDSTPITFRHKSRLVPNLLFAAAALLLLSFLLLLSTYAIHRFTRRRRRRILASSAAAASPGADDDDDDGDSYVADHHVWNIRTVGLDDATIRSIAACVYNAKEGLLGAGQADCAVCLGELSDGELLRLLPKCGHAFHLPCVDTWLRAHVNCPLCRAPVLAPPPHPPPDVETSVSESTPSVVADDTPELKITIGIELAEFGSSSANSGLLNNLGEDGLQPVRRSVSMDSSSLAALLLRGDSMQKPTEEGLVIEIGEQQAVKNMGKQGKGPVQMKRSMSTRSGRFFLSRHARTRNSVIPM